MHATREERSVGVVVGDVITPGGCLFSYLFSGQEVIKETFSNLSISEIAKRCAFFINVGRGRTVVTDDLVDALESGQIGRAALDVMDPEPLPANHPLWQMDNVLITPHLAGRGGNRVRHAILLKENLRRFAAGDALLNVVDPELGY